MAGHGVKDVDKGAQALLKRLHAKIPTVRVGVFGEKAAAAHKDSIAEFTPLQILKAKRGEGAFAKSVKKKLRKEYKKFNRKRAKANATTVGEIASSHEFGLGPPARPWLSGTVEKNKDRIETGLRKVADAVLTGEAKPAQAMRQLGLGIAGMCQEAISEGIPPPLSQAYLKRKLKKYPGATKALIASGQMRASIASDLEGGK